METTSENLQCSVTTAVAKWVRGTYKMFLCAMLESNIKRRPVTNISWKVVPGQVRLLTARTHTTYCTYTHHLHWTYQAECSANTDNNTDVSDTNPTIHDTFHTHSQTTIEYIFCPNHATADFIANHWPLTFENKTGIIHKWYYAI